jgi:hypothetical protein
MSKFICKVKSVNNIDFIKDSKFTKKRPFSFEFAEYLFRNAVYFECKSLFEFFALSQYLDKRNKGYKVPIKFEAGPGRKKKKRLLC